MQEAVIRKYRFSRAKVDANIWDIRDIFRGTSADGDVEKAWHYWGRPEEIPPGDLRIMYRIHRLPLQYQFRIEGLYV